MPRSRAQMEIVAHIRRATGKQYPQLEQAIDNMDEAVIRDLTRLLGDLRFEQDKAVNNARMYPWRR